ncbi:MAG: hypothetical protein AAFX94_14180 [Myxococcota bacterium]
MRICLPPRKHIPCHLIRGEGPQSDGDPPVPAAPNEASAGANTNGDDTEADGGSEEDANAEPDPSPETRRPDEGELPLHCLNGQFDAGQESDVDCGGNCSPCLMGENWEFDTAYSKTKGSTSSCYTNRRCSSQSGCTFDLWTYETKCRPVCANQSCNGTSLHLE